MLYIYGPPGVVNCDITYMGMLHIQVTGTDLNVTCMYAVSIV